MLPLFEALIAGGVRAIEITMTNPNALSAIREAREKIGERALIGVGSLLVSAKILQEADWPELTRRASAFVTAVRQARAG